MTFFLSCVTLREEKLEELYQEAFSEIWGYSSVWSEGLEPMLDRNRNS